MKYIAHIDVELLCEAKNDLAAQELIESHPFFKDITSCGLHGITHLTTTGNQKIISFERKIKKRKEAADGRSD